jgi:hypothetical protein
MDVLSHQGGLFTQALAGGDRGCGVIRSLGCMMGMLELSAMEQTPAPQLEVVM